MKIFYFTFFRILFLTCVCSFSFAQTKTAADTFFLLKKKGLLKRLGESMYVADIIDYEPVKAVNPYQQFNGKTIKSITIAPTGFYTIVADTVDGKKNNFGEKIQDIFHRNTREKVIVKNLFFKVGDKVLPLLFSDNERFLREQSFLQAALIRIEQDSLEIDKVNVFVLSRDVFAIGASIDISNPKKAEITMQDENFFGIGDRLEINGLVDKERHPNYGVGALYTKKNLGGSFINWNTGFKTYNSSFNTGRQEETNIFTTFDKQLVSRYSAWMGSAVISYNSTNNFFKYISETDYNNIFKYTTLTTDLWAGLNIGYKNKRESDNEKRLRHFVAFRSFQNIFFKVPDNSISNYNPLYVDFGGVLASYSLYKQNFYNSTFIYGFGRKEDIPQGLSASILTGYTIKNKVKRPYLGTEFAGTKIFAKGNFVDFAIKGGSFINKNKFDDALFFIGAKGFTRLKKMGLAWRNRSFIGLNFTKQFNTILGFPLVLESENGLPYHNNVSIAADTRTVLKFESVFFNLKKLYGFRLAPFFFTDLGLIKGINEKLNTTKGFPALGGGLRVRNEHLVFGTVELKGFYFPRVDIGIKNWKIELTSKLTFRYNSNFLKKPDFINGN